MRAGKGPKTTAANEKMTSSKLSLAITKLVQDKLLSSYLEVRSLKNSNNQDDNNARLLFIKVGKGLKAIVANRKLANSNLLLILTKLSLGIRQEIRAKKVLILKTG